MAEGNKGNSKPSNISFRQDSGGAPGPKKSIPCPPKPNKSQK